MEYNNSWKKDEPSLPSIYIDAMAKNKLDLYIACTGEEISGLGRIKKAGSKFFIEDILLLEQECTTSSTDLDPKMLDEFLLDEIEKGNSIEDLKVWWHSHANMSTFWSSTDTDTIEKFKNGWFISIVGNKRMEYKVRLDLFEPFRYHFDDLKFEVIVPPIVGMKEMIEAEIAEKVKKKVYTSGYEPGLPYGAQRYDPVTKSWISIANMPMTTDEKRRWFGTGNYQERMKELYEKDEMEALRDVYGCY